MKKTKNVKIHYRILLVLSIFVIFNLCFGYFNYSFKIEAESATGTGTRSAYELKIEVDYFEGLLRPEIIDGFEFLESYFEARGIPTEIDFNSSNNVIEGKGYLTGQEMRNINRQYHDQPTTHIYFVVAKTVSGKAGGAYPLWGPAIGLEMADNYDIRFLIMHEFGHAIGIGLQDDVDDNNETYSTSGFMGYYRNNITKYNSEDWNSSFAPDGSFGNQTWKLARIWNRYSIIGEIYDDTADVFGNAIGDFYEFGPRMILREIEGQNEYSNGVSPDGSYYFQAKPGNYILEIQEEHTLNRTIYVNVTEREVYYLEDVVIELAATPLTESPNVILSTFFVTFTIVIAIGLVYVIKKHKLKGQS